MLSLFYNCCYCSVTRLSCPSLSPRVCSDSCPPSRWCYLTAAAFAGPFSFQLQPSPASESFPKSAPCASGGQSNTQWPKCHSQSFSATPDQISDATRARGSMSSHDQGHGDNTSWPQCSTTLLTFTEYKPFTTWILPQRSNKLHFPACIMEISRSSLVINMMKSQVSQLSTKTKKLQRQLGPVLKYLVCFLHFAAAYYK